MAVVVQVFGLGGFAVLAAVAFEQAAFGSSAGGLAVEQVENALVEAEVLPSAKAICGYCCLQALDLRLDALDQHAGEQIDRDDADLRHAQLDLALHDGFQARPGDAGEGQVDQFVLVVPRTASAPSWPVRRWRRRPTSRGRAG
jgi:hypothetical protein